MIDFNNAGNQLDPGLGGLRDGQPWYDLEAIHARLQDNVDAWFFDHFPNAVIARDRRSARMADVRGNAPSGDGSCKVDLIGEFAGIANDYANNDKAGPLRLLEYATGLHGVELYAYAASLVGVQPSRPAPTAVEKPKEYDAAEAIGNILEKCMPRDNSPTEYYLRQVRGLRAKASEDLKHSPTLWDKDSHKNRPGMVGIVRDVAGEVIGLHRTFLLDDGSGKAPAGKKMLGSMRGGACRLLPIGADGHLGVAEGIETALAAAEIFKVPCWALLSTSQFPSFQWPPEVRKITIFADSGTVGTSKAGELRERITAAGLACEILLPLHGDDFADDLKHGATAESYRTEKPAKIGWGYGDFLGYLPANKFICIDTRELWPAASVNAQLPPKQAGKNSIPASQWLAKHNAVQQMTWAPGYGEVVQNKVISEGGFIDRNDCRIFNLYRPPFVKPGNASDVAPWLDHLHSVYSGEADELICWFAHRVQRPGEKINHALVLGGAPGVGKDTILEPVKYAVGAWNFQEISPQQVLGRFNGFLKSVILRISEARDLGDVDRFAFYDHMKTLTAAPPDVLRCDEKNIREHMVPNVTGVIHTTNYKTDGLYLPADDRRNLVCWSEAAAETFSDDYWTRLYSWYGRGGLRNVAAYLIEYDLSGFDPKKPPRKTEAFRAIVDANRAPEDSELADVLDHLGKPDAVTIERIAMLAPSDLADWLRSRSNRRKLPHRLEAAGYVPVRNESDKRDGQWKVNGKRQTVYANVELCPRDRIEAARRFVDDESR